MDETSQPPDVLVSVSRRTGTSLGVQVEQQLRWAIRSGTLRPGVRLPSTRNLADQLGVSRRVTTSAYAQLAAEGYLVLRQGARPTVAYSPRRVGGRSLSHRPRSVRGSTSGRTSPTCPPSPVRTGPGTCALRHSSCPRPTSITAIRVACPAYGWRSPTTSAACGVWSPTRPGSSSRPASRKDAT